MRQGILPAAVLALVACLSAGCNDGDNGADSTGSDRYVALGDSYTSGPRLGEPSGEPGCEQTTGNYPHLLAERLDLKLVDVSCGAARSEHLEEPQAQGNGREVPPQLDAVTADTDLVTLSIGGNDGRVFGNLITTCVGLAAKNPGGAPCTKLGKSDNGALEEQISEISGRIEDAVAAIGDRAPGARVIVVGYPQIFPESGTCEALPLAPGDYPFAYDVIRSIVEAQEEGARRSGAEYVDIWSASAGHDICSDDPWVAGIVPEKRALSYHPYAEHQEAVADELEALVRSDRED